MEPKLNGFGREYVRDPIIPLKYIYTLSCRVFHKIFMLYTTECIIIQLHSIPQGVL